MEFIKLWDPPPCMYNQGMSLPAIIVIVAITHINEMRNAAQTNLIITIMMIIVIIIVILADGMECSLDS